MTGYSNQAINVFNNHFFPGITEGHFTFGGGMALGKTSTLEFAVVYADEVSKTVDTGYSFRVWLRRRQCRCCHASRYDVTYSRSLATRYYCIDTHELLIAAQLLKRPA